MNPEEYDRHFRLEDTHWWFAGRRALVRRILDRYAPARPLGRILDAGCGTGANLRVLGPGAFGCDLSAEALRLSRRRGLSGLARADVARLPYHDAGFDAVTLFDVLYHKKIKDDVAVLEEVRRVLRPGGYCLITDSALRSLHGPHDAAVGARERYTKKSLRAKVEKAGFEILKITYFYSSPFPAVFLSRQLQRLSRKAWVHPRSDLGPVPASINAALTRMMLAEAAVAARVDLPLGSSLVCLARKPGRGSLAGRRVQGSEGES